MNAHKLGDGSIELHGARTGNSLRAAIALEESGLPYAVRKVDLAAGEHRMDAFRRLNQAGKVPALIDRRGNGDDLVITQSNAIMLHVSDAVPGLLAPAEAGTERTRFLERFFYFVTDVIAPNHAVFALRFSDAKEAIAVLSKLSVTQMEAAERYLDKGPFMAGERFSLVDIAAFTIARSISEDIDWASRPLLRAWFEMIATRPGVIRGSRVFDAPPP